MEECREDGLCEKCVKNNGYTSQESFRERYHVLRGGGCRVCGERVGKIQRYSKGAYQ